MGTSYSYSFPPSFPISNRAFIYYTRPHIFPNNLYPHLPGLTLPRFSFTPISSIFSAISSASTFLNTSKPFFSPCVPPLKFLFYIRCNLVTPHRIRFSVIVSEIFICIFFAFFFLIKKNTRCANRIDVPVRTCFRVERR